MYSMKEDELLKSLTKEHCTSTGGGKWSVILPIMQKAFPQRYLTNSCLRNRYQRIRKGEERRINGTCKKRCSKCGQFTAGHSCGWPATTNIQYCKEDDADESTLFKRYLDQFECQMWKEWCENGINHRLITVCHVE